MAGRTKKMGVLGNDPFLRAAAAPAVEPAPPAAPEALTLEPTPPLERPPSPRPRKPAAGPKAAAGPRATGLKATTRPKKAKRVAKPGAGPAAVDLKLEGLKLEGVKLDGVPTDPVKVDVFPPEASPPPQALVPVAPVPDAGPTEEERVHVGVVDQPSLLERLGGERLMRALDLGAAMASRLSAASLVTRVWGAANAGAAAVQALLSPPSGPAQVDELGKDAALVQRTSPMFDFLIDHYWRVRTQGADQLPRGPMLVVANHAGALPLDGPVLCSVLQRALGEEKVRWLVEDALFHAPWVGTWLNRLGAVRACPENAFRLLESGHTVVVFPEGVSGLTKGYRQRYQLQRFGRGGFVKLALRARVPMLPAAVVGVEEAMPVSATVSAPRLGFPFIPITPTFPWLGPLGLMPRPVPWTIRFGEPIGVSHRTPADADDLALVQKLTEDVRDRIAYGIREIRAA